VDPQHIVADVGQQSQELAPKSTASFEKAKIEEADCILRASEEKLRQELDDIYNPKK